MTHPDADVYPTATGRAASLVQQHSAPQSLKLYGSWFCPFVQRVWIALEEKQIPYEYVEVNPYDKPASLLRLNPRGLVPALDVAGKPLYESSVILEFLEDGGGGGGGGGNGVELLPEDAYERAYARIWVDYVGSRILPAFHRYLQFTPKEDAEGLEEKRAEFLQTLRTFTGAMREPGKGAFFLGADGLSLVDVAIAPWLRRLWVLDYYKGPFSIPDTPEWDRWRLWAAAVESKKSLLDTESDNEHLKKIYKRYADDTAQSEAAKAIRAGRAIP